MCGEQSGEQRRNWLSVKPSVWGAKEREKEKLVIGEAKCVCGAKEREENLVIGKGKFCMWSEVKKKDYFSYGQRYLFVRVWS